MDVINSTSILVHWNVESAPNQNISSLIIRYSNASSAAEWRHNRDAVAVRIEGGALAGERLIDGLHPSTKYTVTIAAVADSNGVEGFESSTLVSTLDGDGDSSPPFNVTCINKGGTLLIEWAKPHWIDDISQFEVRIAPIAAQSTDAAFVNVISRIISRCRSRPIPFP